MLIYDSEDIRLYATEIPPHPEGVPAARSVAEREGVDRLLREAFPAGNARLAHLESGAPYLKFEGEEPRYRDISISHCRKIAVIALGAKGIRIGVDCENGNRAGQLRRVAPRFLTEEQLPRWSGSEEALFQAWTIKEAAYKAALDPSLTLAELPLPEEVPTGKATADSEIAIGGRRYGVFQADSPYPGVIIMVVRGISAR